MKKDKLFLILTLTLLLSTNIFGQAAVDIPLIATEGTRTFSLAVGLDLTATNCIDFQLGESDLPPIPPGLIEIAFDLYPYGCAPLLTYKDYRAPGSPPVFPFTGLIEHMLWWNAMPGTPIDITYNIPSSASMTITDVINGSLLILGPFSGQGVTTIPSNYTAYLNKVFLKMNYDAIIPVELISFSASVLEIEKGIQLNWKTVTETNNSGFEILRGIYPERNRRAQNDSEWETIGFVPGFGTTTEPKAYSFIDENVTNGIYKYRLKQIDFDGSFEFSNEIEVVVDFTPKEFVLFQNYPNPFNPSTVITFEIPGQARNDNMLVTLKVYDILGNEIVTLVNEEKQSGVYEVEFDASSLASGMYLYKLQAGSFIQTKKMILTK